MIRVTNTTPKPVREVTIVLSGNDAFLFDALLNQYQQNGGNANVAGLVNSLRAALAWSTA